MSLRSRFTLGLAAAIAVGSLGPALTAVANHSGTGISTISGRITSGGRPASGMCASAWFARDTRIAPVELYAGSAVALLDGTYTLRNLPADSYKVEFHACNARRVNGFRVGLVSFSEYWPNSPLYENARTIEVGAREDITGINAETGPLQ